MMSNETSKKVDEIITEWISTHQADKISRYKVKQTELQPCEPIHGADEDRNGRNKDYCWGKLGKKGKKKQKQTLPDPKNTRGYMMVDGLEAIKDFNNKQRQMNGI